MITSRYISICTYDEIRNICKSYIRVATKKGKGIRGFVPQNSKTIVGLTKVEIGNLLEDMKRYILHLFLF
jgi:hypothetical protein